MNFMSFMDRKQTMVDLGNGMEMSIVWGEGLYCSARQGGSIDDPDATFEVGILMMDGRGFYPLDLSDDVIGWVTREEIAALISRAMSIDPVTVANVEPGEFGIKETRDPLGLWGNFQPDVTKLLQQVE